MSNDDIIIEARNITKRFGSFVAVDGVSFSCRRGEIVGFLGPNGAGKTTTMRVLTSYTPPSSGTAHIAGYDTISNSLEARRHLGYLPESVPLYDEMSVEGYLVYVARLRRLEDVWDRVDDALESVGLLDRAGSTIGTLSKGMRQRVGLAQAIMHEPDALILDEPTIGLDPRQVLDVREVIRGLGERHTILLSTHIMSEVEQLCDRVIMIFNGRIGTDMRLAEINRPEAGERLRLRMAVPDPMAAESLSRVPGVEAVTAGDAGNYELQTDGQDATRLAVVDTIHAGGWGLLELAEEKVTLESVFLRDLRAAEAAQMADAFAADLLAEEEE
jgi:ABC-2 type transport system ATP-binding protein